MNKKILVSYFSCSGVTENTAKLIAQAVNGDLYEIQPKVPYTKADLDWTNKNSRSTLEMKDPSSRPEIGNKVDNMQEYDIVFVGFPIWWYVAPTIINTFLESYDFTGKTIIPFATSGSSPMGKTDEVLHSLLSNDVNWKESKLLNGMKTLSDINEWVSSLDL